MMLGEPRDAIAELIGEPGLLGDLGKDLRRRFSDSRAPIRLKDPNSMAPPPLRSRDATVAVIGRKRKQLTRHAGFASFETRPPGAPQSLDSK